MSSNAFSDALNSIGISLFEIFSPLCELEFSGGPEVSLGLSPVVDMCKTDQDAFSVGLSHIICYHTVLARVEGLAAGI